MEGGPGTKGGNGDGAGGLADGVAAGGIAPVSQQEHVASTRLSSFLL